MTERSSQQQLHSFTNDLKSITNRVRLLDRHLMDLRSNVAGLAKLSELAKLVAAARLVNVSDGGRVIACFEQASDLDTAADCVDCLDSFYRWDIGRIGDDPEAAAGF
jgi:hypothetical protein